MTDLRIFGGLLKTIAIVAVTALLWLYLLEELGLGAWECWPR